MSEADTPAVAVEESDADRQDQHVRIMVSSLGEKAVTWLEQTKESSTYIKGGIDIIEDRLQFLREPMMAHWQNYGDPCITKADDLSRAILTPVKAVEDHVQWAQTTSRDIVTHQLEVVRNNPLVSWISFRDPPASPSSNSSDGEHGSDLLSPTPSIFTQLDKLKQIVIARIRRYQEFVQKSPQYSDSQRLSLLGMISDLSTKSMQTIESFRTHVLEGGQELVDSSHWFGRWPVPSSTSLMKPLVNHLSPSVTALHDRVLEMLNHVRRILGLSSEGDLFDETESLSTVSEASLNIDRNANLRFNPNAAEFVPVVEPRTQPPTSPPHNHGVSVAGMGTYGLDEEHAALCLRAVSILQEMLREREGTPLKQPGLSRKLYSRHPELKEAIEAAHGLRAFVKRFPDKFRLFPGKGTVWFVTLRDAPNKDEQSQPAIALPETAE